MSLSSGRLEVGDRGCAMDERRGVTMPCVVVDVTRDGRVAVVRFELDGRKDAVWREDFYFEAEAS